MAQRRIVWTKKANKERRKILEYWVNRNKSKRFSQLLNKRIISELRLVSKNPLIGKKTDLQNVRIIILKYYLLFYEITETEIVVLTIWDSRRNPDKLTIRD